MISIHIPNAESATTVCPFRSAMPLMVTSCFYPCILLWGDYAFDFFQVFIAPDIKKNKKSHTVFTINSVEGQIFFLPSLEYLGCLISRDKLNNFLSVFQKIAECGLRFSRDGLEKLRLRYTSGLSTSSLPKEPSPPIDLTLADPDPLDTTFSKRIYLNQYHAATKKDMADVLGSKDLIWDYIVKPAYADAARRITDSNTEDSDRDPVRSFSTDESGQLP